MTDPQSPLLLRSAYQTDGFQEPLERNGGKGFHMLDSVTVLIYCCNVLARRMAADRAEAWFWKLRRKVALY